MEGAATPRRATTRLVDAAWRAGYRLAYRLARLWWALRRPDRHGVVVAIWYEGQVLVLRQSYRPGPTFPGGLLRVGEDPVAAARRELREEVGLDLPADRLRLAQSLVLAYESCRDHVQVFEVTLATRPRLVPDRREVVAAAFLDPKAVLAGPVMPPFVRIYLEERTPPPAAA